MDYDQNSDMYRRSGVFSTYLKLLREKPTLAKENPKLIRTIAETCKVPVSVVYKEAGIPEPGTQCEENNKKTIHDSVVNKSNVLVPEVKVTDSVDTNRNCYQKSTTEVNAVEKNTKTAVADINIQKRTTTQAMTIPQETNTAAGQVNAIRKETQTAVVIKDPNNVSKDTESKVATVNSEKIITTQAKAVPQYINKAVATINAGLSNVINVRKTATPIDCSVVIINIDDDSTDKIISRPTSTPLENKINECTVNSPILDTYNVAGLKHNDEPKEKDTITYNKQPHKLSKEKRSLIRKKIRDLFLLESSLTVNKAMVEVNADPALPNFTDEVFYNLLKMLKIGYNDKCITFTREVNATDALYLKEINTRQAENKSLTNNNSESAVRTRKTYAANEKSTSDLATNVYNQLFGVPSITDDADSDDEAEAPASDVDDPDYAPEIPQLRRAVETSDEETDDDDFIVHDSDSNDSEFSDDSNRKDDDNNGEADSDHSSSDENVNGPKQAVFVPVDMCENESDVKADEDKVIASPQPPFDDDVIIIDEAQTKIFPKSKLTSEADPLTAFDDIQKNVVSDRRLSADDVIFVDDPVVHDVISVEKPIQWNPSELALTFDHVRGMPVLVKKTAVVKTPDVEKLVPVREVTKLPVLPKKEIRINIHRPCRICMKNVPDTVDIFNPIRWSTEMVPISEMVMKYAKIKVSKRDQLPNLICKICLGNLKAAEKFTYTCEKTDRLFSRLLRKELNINGWDDNLENKDESVTLEPNSTDGKTKDIDEGLKQYILNEYFDSANNKMRDIIEAIFKDGKYKCNDCLKTKTYDKDTTITTILNSRSEPVGPSSCLTNEFVDKPVSNDNKKHLKGKKSKTWSISKKSSKNSHLFEDLPPHIEDSNSSSCSDSARPKSPIVFVLRSNKNKTDAQNVIASTVPQIVHPTISRTISAGADHTMSTTVPQPIYTTSQSTYHVVPQTASTTFPKTTCSTVAQTKHITIPQSVYSNIAQNLSISSQSVSTSVPQTQYNRSVFHKTIFHTSDISNCPQSEYATATQPVPQCQTVSQAINPSASHNASLPNNVMVRIDDQNFLDVSGSSKRKQQDEIRLTSHAKKSKYVDPAPPDDIFEISDGEDESILHAALNTSSTTVQNSVGSNVVQSLNTSRHCSTMPQTNKITNFGIAYPPGHPSQIAVSQSSAIVEKSVVQHNVVQNNKRKPRSQSKSSTDLQKIKKVRKITPKQIKPPPFVQRFQNLSQTQEYAHNNTNNYSSSTQVVKPVQDLLHTPSVLPAPTLPLSALAQQLPEQYQQNYHITITPSSKYGSGGTVQMSGINNDVLVQLSDVPQLSWVDTNYCQPQQQLQLQTQTLGSSSFGSLVDPVTGMFFVTTDASNEQSTMYLCSESPKRDQNQLMYPQLSGVTSNGIENVTNNTLTTNNNNVQLLNGTLPHNQVRAENYTILDEQSGNQVESSNKTFEDVEAMLKMTLISNDVMDPTTNEDGAIRISQIESLYGQDPHAKPAKPSQSLYDSQPSTAVQAPRTYSKRPAGTLKVRNISELI